MQSATATATAPHVNVRPAVSRHPKTVKSAADTKPTSQYGRMLRVIKKGTNNGKLAGARKAGAVAPASVDAVAVAVAATIKRQPIKAPAGTWTAGAFRGQLLFALTLVERETCPTDCDVWDRCFGDNMHLAIRHRPDGSLLPILATDLDVMDARGVAYSIRLHILGDVYSAEYAAWWLAQIIARPLLHIYGYTHWSADSVIGRIVSAWKTAAPARIRMLRSNGRGLGAVSADGFIDNLPATAVVKEFPAGRVAGWVKCPEQTGAIAGCLDCGICANGISNVLFVDHGADALRDKRRAVAAGAIARLNLSADVAAIAVAH